MESTPIAYADAYRRAYDEAAALVEPLSVEAFNWKPGPERWSVAECLVHLNTTNAPYVTAMEAALAEGGPKGAPPFRYGPVARWFIATTGPQPRRPMKTPTKMRPAASSFAPDRVLADFRALTDGFLGVIERAEREGLDLARLTVRSPFLPILRLPLGACLEALAGHEQRHLDQARRVTEHPDFPR